MADEEITQLIDEAQKDYEKCALELDTVIKDLETLNKRKIVLSAIKTAKLGYVDTLTRAANQMGVKILASPMPTAKPGRTVIEEAQSQ